ncbi:hypothetical protein EON81_10140 [bacterium]|nr:MAG: hypothetical protein EON81_10140 [bacterium]
MNISPIRVFAGTAAVATIGVGAFVYAANGTPVAAQNPSMKEMEKIGEVYQKHEGEEGWIDGEQKWHSGRYRQMFLPETPEEREISAALQDGPATVVYTVGLPNAEGLPQRIKGPAYVTNKSDHAPQILPDIVHVSEAAAKEARNKIMAASAELRTKDSVMVDGWRFVAYDVKADGKDCLKCHRTSDYPVAGAKIPQLKVGDTVGRFLIATKVSPQVR